MLINFTVGNYRSFKNEKTLSMEAAPIKEHKDVVISVDKYKLLPLAVLYGANSSGKSNVLSAFSVMKYVVVNSVKLNPDEEIVPFFPFMLDTKSFELPTSFEVEFLIGTTYYRYGFEYNEKIIATEWLYERLPGEKEYNLFLRSGSAYKVSSTRFAEGKGKETSTSDNRLFLSLVAQLRGQKSVKIIEWFSNINFISGLNNSGYESFTKQMIQYRLEGFLPAFNFFQKLQLGFKDIKVKETDIPSDFKKALVGAPLDVQKKLLQERYTELRTTHEIFDESGSVVRLDEFSEEVMESEGTKKVIELSGPLFDTLLNGKILLVDELDAKLHPILTRNIIMLFNDPQQNKKGAQLIFATHDTNLLNINFVRRDQVWFTEKDPQESTDLYSLVEFKDEEGIKVRKDRSLAKDYINGRFGAIPFIGG